MLLILATVAAASTPQASQPARNDDPVICKRSETPDVGTHMRPKSVCMKRSEWDYVQKDAERGLQTFRDHSSNPGTAAGRASNPH